MRQFELHLSQNLYAQNLNPCSINKISRGATAFCALFLHLADKQSVKRGEIPKKSINKPNQPIDYQLDGFLGAQNAAAPDITICA